MSIIKIRKPKSNYSIIHNDIVNDKDLSYKELGLLVYLLSKPDNWQVRVNELVSAHQEGRDAVRNIIKNLIAKGYITRQIRRDASGTITGTEYEVYDTKQMPDKPETEDPDADLPATDFQAPVNPETEGQAIYKDLSLVSTEVNNTNINNTPYNPPLGDGQTPVDDNSKQPDLHTKPSCAGAAAEMSAAEKKEVIRQHVIEAYNQAFKRKIQTLSDRAFRNLLKYGKKHKLKTGDIVKMLQRAASDPWRVEMMQKEGPSSSAIQPDALFREENILRYTVNYQDQKSDTPKRDPRKLHQYAK